MAGRNGSFSVQYVVQLGFFVARLKEVLSGDDRKGFVIWRASSSHYLPALYSRIGFSKEDYPRAPLPYCPWAYPVLGYA